MTRVRMIILFDLAKQINSLVAEQKINQKDYLAILPVLATPLRHEPIAHLYKTQIYQLAKYLKVPKNY